MTTTAATIDSNEWLACFADAARNFAAASLRFEDGVAPESTLGGSRPAAYITILGESTSVHLGIAASEEGCRTLARAFLGMRRKEEISESDVVDGLSEILNIVAGKVKSKLSGRDRTLRLGLPMFVVGQIQHRENMERASADVMLGPVPCQLLVFRTLASAPRPA